MYQEDFHHHRAHLFELFGPIVGNIPHGIIFPYIILFMLIQDDASQATHTPDNQSQIIISLFLSASIFAKFGNHCYLHYFGNLVHLDKVRHLNWEGATYATFARGTWCGVQKTNINQDGKISNLPVSVLLRLIVVMRP